MYARIKQGVETIGPLKVGVLYGVHPDDEINSWYIFDDEWGRWDFGTDEIDMFEDEFGVHEIDPHDLELAESKATGPEEDLVNAPNHYSFGVPGDFEVIDVILAQGWENNWYMASALKYILRAQYKGKYEQDLRKAIKMIEWELEREDDDNE